MAASDVVGLETRFQTVYPNIVCQWLGEFGFKGSLFRSLRPQQGLDSCLNAPFHGLAFSRISGLDFSCRDGFGDQQLQHGTLDQ